MSQQSLPRPYTKEQIALLSRHASERAELDAEFHNARVAIVTRQQAEWTQMSGGQPTPLPQTPDPG